MFSAEDESLAVRRGGFGSMLIRLRWLDAIGQSLAIVVWEPARQFNMHRRTVRRILAKHAPK